MCLMVNDVGGKPGTSTSHCPEAGVRGPNTGRGSRKSPGVKGDIQPHDRNIKQGLRTLSLP